MEAQQRDVDGRRGSSSGRANKAGVQNDIIGFEDHIENKVKAKDFAKKEGIQSQKFSSSAKFFCKHSCRDVRRRKLHFCLAFCSVFIVVISSLVVSSVVERGPVIFLRMAEAQTGQIDAFITPAGGMTGTQLDDNYGVYLNYTRMEELWGTTKWNMSPRKSFNSAELATTKEFSEADQAAWQARFDQDSWPSREQVYDDQLIFTTRYRSNIILIDTNREREINVGRLYPFGAQEYGECILPEQQAQVMGVGVGEIIYAQVDLGKMLNTLGYSFNTTDENGFDMVSLVDLNLTRFPCKVSALNTEAYGKFGTSAVQSTVIMEYRHFLPLLGKFIPDPLNVKGFPEYVQGLTSRGDTAGNNPMANYADQLVVTLPEPRTTYYQSSDYDNIQLLVTEYFNQVTSDLGFYPVFMNLEILGQMKTYSQAVMFLGLVFDIIILLFVIISIFLIYSLLMISIETKTFEIGVMRMVGLDKSGLIFMIGLQATLFVLPSLILGFAFSFPILYFLYQFLFSSEMGISFDPVPSWFATLQALFIGLVIPFVSSIAPVQSALSKNLNDALNYQRSKTNAMFVEILQTNKKNISGMIVFGIIAVVYGLSIYYLLPLSMLSFNFSLILRIFFMILLGMLFGLSLMAMNIQRFVEIAMVYLTLFWEKPSMRAMVLKNLVAHKLRNRLTAIIYSLALGFIIFLIVSLKLQIESSSMMTQKTKGSQLLLETGDLSSLKPSRIETSLQENEHLIDSFAWSTFDMARITSIDQLQSVYVTDIGRVDRIEMGIYGVTPDIFSCLESQYTSISNQNTTTALSLGEQLYTARGSQSMGYGSQLNQVLGTSDYPDDWSHIYNFMAQYIPYRQVYEMRTIFSMAMTPAFRMQDTAASYGKAQAMISLPMLATYGDLSIAELPMERLFIKPKEGVTINQLIVNFRKNFNDEEAASISFFDATADAGTLEETETILTLVFNVIITVTMFLCFFSLSSSMSSNLYEQAKELAVLRAIGFTSARIVLLYIYEAFILVVSASLLGIFIGTMVGYTMTIQQTTFQKIPLQFFFPYTQFIMVLMMSILCAFLATFGPARALLKKQIAAILRMT